MRLGAFSLSHPVSPWLRLASVVVYLVSCLLCGSLFLLSGYAALIGARSANATYVAVATALIIGAIAFADGVARNRKNEREYQESLAYLKIFGAGLYESEPLDSFGKSAAGRPVDPHAKPGTRPARAPKARKKEPRPRRKPAVETAQPSP